MKNLLRICVIALAAIPLGSVARAQEGSSRAEFDCLALTRSSGLGSNGEASRFPAFHHVWIPGLVYGTFESNGLRLVYETQGSGDDVVIVVHGGAGLPHDYFHPMLSNLSRYAKLVYFDRRADMQSSRSGHGMASVAEMADDVDALRLALGVDRVTLLGHSFGATIALNYALRYPANVKRLILVSAAASVENPAEAEKRILKKLSPAEMSNYRSSEGGKGAASPCDRVRMRYAVLYPHYFYELSPYEFNRGAYIAYFDSLAKKIALAEGGRSIDVSGRLRDIQAPALVIAGKHDLVTPPDQSDALAKGLPRARLVVLQRSGHFPFFEENYLFSEWVRQFMLATSNEGGNRLARGSAAQSSDDLH